jgi:hypothetical protein
MTGEWVFPVGHYLGAFHPGPGEPVLYHRVRVGTELVQLDPDSGFPVWGLAHGLPATAQNGEVWTRAALVELARRPGDADLAGTIDDLLAGGALVEVGADGIDPATFARRYRLQPLLTGMGAGPGRPDRFLIGVLGSEPAAIVDMRVFDLWQWASRAGNLWDLNELQVVTAPLLGHDDDGVPGLLHRVHTLLANGCGYLDVAGTSM